MSGATLLRAHSPSKRKGALTIETPTLGDPTHFWMIDEKEVAGHVWVVAPPFDVVGVTLQAQPYQRGEAALVPRTVVVEGAERITPEANEYVATGVLEREARRYGPLPHDIHLRMVPGLARAVSFFPSWKVHFGDTVLRYAAGGVTVSDGLSLHSITSRRWNGLLAVELYDQVVRPVLRASS